MNFYYDIALDFLENNYLFYDVAKTDKFWSIKKIPLFQVSSKTRQDFNLNKIQVDATFLKMIENKTVTATGKIKYAAILADKNSAEAYLFNDEGVVTHYSPLALVDEINLLEVIYTIKNIEINYEIKGKNKINPELRQEKYLQNLIKEEIIKLYHQKNLLKLQFLYLEWFDILETNIDVIYNKMLAALNEKIDAQAEKIGKIIEMSYNHV